MREKIGDCLAAVRDILARIRVNTGIQSRLIAKRQMTGLRRLLREQAVLIGELAAANGRLRAAEGVVPAGEARAMAELEQSTLAGCQQVMRQARAEQARIAVELKRSKAMRQAKNRYLDQWQMAAGRRLNIKG